MFDSIYKRVASQTFEFLNYLRYIDCRAFLISANNVDPSETLSSVAFHRLPVHVRNN